MNKAFLLMGGNEGDRCKNLKTAMNELKNIEIKIIRQSKIYETAAWGLENQPSFLNLALMAETNLDSISLLSSLLDIELLMGRQRLVKFGPRTIDIDILFFNNEVVSTRKLVVPHPELQNRRFALVPLCEIAPAHIHPVLQLTVAELLSYCPDNLQVKVFSC